MKFLLIVFQWFVILLLLVLLPRQDITTVTALQHMHLQGCSSSKKTTTRTTTRQSSSNISRHSVAESSSFQSSQSVDEKQKQSSSSPLCCWKSPAFLSTCVAGALLLGGGVSPVHANNDDTATTVATTVATTAASIGRDSIAPCSKLVAADQNGAKNCVSTASVRQLDLYAAPWTFSGGNSLTNVQVLEYLQQALREADRLVEIVQVDNDDSALRATTTRGLAKDQLDFYINRDDHVIQFVSRQVQGPDISDLGVNRKRLEEVRKRTPFGIMGVNAGDEERTNKREGALGQLKAFYGLQSGAGFEGVLLNDDDD